VATLPPGERKGLGEALGEAWVLTGRQVLWVLVGDGPVSGELDVQLCTDSVCSRPEKRLWTAR
jgi:hypothetical protein